MPCAGCFNLPRLKKLVYKSATKTGDCRYCGRKRVRLAPLGVFYDGFRNMMQLYEPADNWDDGETLVQLMEDDWQPFAEELLGTDAVSRLLSGILASRWEKDSGDDEVDVYDLYVRVGDNATNPRESLAERWDEFAAEVLEDPSAEPPIPDTFTDDLPTETLRAGTRLYRVRPAWRPDSDGARLPWTGNVECGAPPADKATAGRANSSGERVLYAADQEETAVAEVRPALGHVVTLAEFQVVADLRVVDLVSPIEDPDPFEDETVVYDVEIAGLLRSFAIALGTPLARGDDPNLYLPSQKLCREIREAGYDGIRYPSAMKEGGSNLVLFDPARVDFMRSRLVKVTAVEVKYEDDNEQ
jgi:RES domain-containing protein